MGEESEHHQHPAGQAEQLQHAERRVGLDFSIGGGKAEYLLHPVPERQEPEDHPGHTLQLGRQSGRDGARHDQFTMRVVERAGFTKRASGIWTFGWISVSSNCDRPLSHATVHRDGTFTPATSLYSW